MVLKLNLQNHRIFPEAPGIKLCRSWVQAALLPAVKMAEVTLRMVDKPEGAALNAQYRHKEGATNILSFPYDWPDQAEGELLGDLVICVPLVAEEALAQGKTLGAHWAHLLVHGTLHLQGWDHQDPQEAEVMEALETDILLRLGFPSPYGEYGVNDDPQ